MHTITVTVETSILLRLRQDGYHSRRRSTSKKSMHRQGHPRTRQPIRTLVSLSPRNKLSAIETTPRASNRASPTTQPPPPPTPDKMLTRAVRTRLPGLSAAARPALTRGYNNSENPVPTNEPRPAPPKPNVSATSGVPTSSAGSFDKILQEAPAVAEELRVAQSPNRANIWSRSQNPRGKAMSGPRFEQAIMEDQVGAVLLQMGREVDEGVPG